MKPAKTLLALGLSILAVLITATKSPAAHVGSSPTNSTIKIVLVGDSTVTDNAGWGLGFKQFLTDRAECFNTSRGGRSSQSFLTEGRWTNALALKGEYYLIQFGHNNEPGKPGRSTDMPTFVANMNQYVDEARAISAKPVLVTPLTRRQWDKAHPSKIKSSLAPYAEEVRKIATAKNIPLVDLQARSIELCESLGREKCLNFSPLKTVDGTNTYDNTHLNEKGYVLFARLVVEELRKNVPELATALRTEPLNPNPIANDTTTGATSEEPSEPKPHDYARWEKEVSAMEASDRTNTPPKNAVLFIGSSTIRLWKTLAKDYPDTPVINRGFGGTQIVDATYYAERLVFPHAPKQIFLRAGGNDLNAGKTPEQVFGDFKDFVSKIHARLPDTEIVFISQSPSIARWPQAEREKKLNSLAADFIKGKARLKYIETYDIVFGDDSKPRAELFISDKLHFNAEGYKLLAERVRPALMK